MTKKIKTKLGKTSNGSTEKKVHKRGRGTVFFSFSFLPLYFLNMSFQPDHNATAGLDVFGTAIKKNKGLISRMKRSLSSSGRPMK